MTCLVTKLSRQGLKVFEFVGMFSINKYSRNFKPGIPLSKDFRNDVIQRYKRSIFSRLQFRSTYFSKPSMSFWNFHSYCIKFRKSCSRQCFIITLDENPRTFTNDQKAEAYLNRSGSISSKKSSISILSAILVNCARTPFKLQMFGSQTCHVCTQLEHVFLSRVHA